MESPQADDSPRDSLKPRDMVNWLRNVATEELARVIKFILDPLPTSSLKLSPSIGRLEVTTPWMQEPLPLAAVGEDGKQVHLPQVLGVVYKAVFDFLEDSVHFYSGGDPAGKFPAYLPSISSFALDHDKNRENQWVLHLGSPKADKRVGTCCVCSKVASTFFSVRMQKNRGETRLMCGECIKYRPLVDIYDYYNPYIINDVASMMLPSDDTPASAFLM